VLDIRILSQLFHDVNTLDTEKQTLYTMSDRRTIFQPQPQPQLPSFWGCVAFRQMSAVLKLSRTAAIWLLEREVCKVPAPTRRRQYTGLQDGGGGTYL